MKYNKFTFNNSDNIELFLQKWSPKKIAQGSLFIIHGLGEHSSRYHELAKYFVEKHFNVFSFDLRGHGKSKSKRGYIDNFSNFIKDIEEVFQFLELDLDIPQFLYGHSMGGNIALNYLMRKEHSFKSAIITSPWIKIPNLPPRPIYKVGKTLSNLYPEVTFKGLITKKFQKMGVDEKTILDKKNDVLNHDQISARLFFECQEAGSWILNNPDKLKTDTLLLHSTKDIITSHEASKKFSILAADKVNFISREDNTHELQHGETSLEIWEIMYKYLAKYI